MADAVLLEKGRKIRRALVGDVCADKLDSEVYVDAHMAKFGDLTQEVVFAQLWTRPGLDLKTKALIIMITDVSTGMTEALGLHIRFCLNHGWSEDEIVDAILHCMAYVGVPLVRKAMVVATQVFAEVKQNGEFGTPPR